ncbi:MAG: hypothetical protein ACYDHW_06060 [Syntrophorhabdaceae bacterium]
MPTIGQKTVEAVSDKFRMLLMEHKADLDKAWLACDKTLSIPVSLKFKNGPGSGDMEYSVSLDIVTDRVKTAGHGVVNEKQDELFPLKDSTPEDPLKQLMAYPILEKNRKWFAMPDCRLEIYKQ